MGPETLAPVVPLLRELGAGGVAWWPLRCAGAANARVLHPDYRQLVIESFDRDGLVRTAVRRLRAAEVEPIIVKGWAAARHYALPCLRPYGDLDLCLAPDQLDAALAALGDEFPPGAVDLHRGVPDLNGRRWDDVCRRSRLVALGDEAVRVLGPEDHLRLVCTHLARHAFFRPLWLCDAAAALEARPADFDWDWCLHGNGADTRWLVAALGLAERLLGARLGDFPQAARARALSRWLVGPVLWRWGAGQVHKALPHHRGSLADVGAWFFNECLDPICSAWRLRLCGRHWLWIGAVHLTAQALAAGVKAGRLLARRDAAAALVVHRASRI